MSNLDKGVIASNKDWVMGTGYYGSREEVAESISPLTPYPMLHAQCPITISRRIYS
ncbi:hypothetical protein [Nostoc sp. CHAB 5715]|uniref:hypothetical protein n=1 Tax=Nostoc sp. CHAB 5715 TaxID=2780400 RepID=UPI001E5A8662|nr:hypothetical protein [Nostoc sp. CHAB 5715]MCC5620525.1 hypothetical protein [Nostoc sp. CHAB 5715]